MATYSPHTSVFLDTIEAMIWVQSTICLVGKQNQMVQFDYIQSVWWSNSQTCPILSHCQNQSKSILFSFVRLETVGKMQGIHKLK